MSKIAYIRHLPRMVAGVVITLLLVGVCVFAVVQSPTRDGKIALAVIAVLAAVALVRIVRSGVVVTEDGLVIRNWWRSHTVPWWQIVGFFRPTRVVGTRTIGLNLVGDRRLSCPALQTLGGLPLVAAGTAGPAGRAAAFDSIRRPPRPARHRRCRVHPPTSLPTTWIERGGPESWGTPPIRQSAGRAGEAERVLVEFPRVPDDVVQCRPLWRPARARPAPCHCPRRCA